MFFDFDVSELSHYGHFSICLSVNYILTIFPGCALKALDALNLLEYSLRKEFEKTTEQSNISINIPFVDSFLKIELVNFETDFILIFVIYYMITIHSDNTLC